MRFGLGEKNAPTVAAGGSRNSAHELMVNVEIPQTRALKRCVHGLKDGDNCRWPS
jgi:hypothetical protein